MNELKGSLENWLLSIISVEQPSKAIKVLRFGLYEALLSEDLEIVGAILYLAGHNEFDAGSDEWACEQPEFVANEELCVLRLTDGQWLLLPNGTELAENVQEEITGDDWMSFVTLLRQLLSDFLTQQKQLINSFPDRLIPVFVGFEDGDLEKIK